jgi:hypothetical protein
MTDGIGVMIRALGGYGESAAIFKEAIGKTIQSAEMSNNALELRFTDGTGISLRDLGQCCCESRYASTDDDLAYHVGATLVDAEVAAADDVHDNDCETHEVAFLRVSTSKGVITVANHNEHNGYYGGFSVEASRL